jgi:hypothetical protein
LKQLYWFLLGGFACWLPTAALELATHKSILEIYDPIGVLLSLLIPAAGLCGAYLWLRGPWMDGYKPAFWMLAGSQVLATAFIELGAIGWRHEPRSAVGLSESNFVLIFSIPLLNWLYIGETGKILGLFLANVAVLLSARRSRRRYRKDRPDSGPIQGSNTAYS